MTKKKFGLLHKRQFVLWYFTVQGHLYIYNHGQNCWDNEVNEAQMVSKTMNGNNFPLPVFSRCQYCFGVVGVT